MLKQRPIGIFDSGIGGLTVVKNIMNILPNEDIIYFADIARIPYGIKSKNTIKKFSVQIVKFLIKKKVKVIVIACNTISAIAKEIIKKNAKNIPIIDIISATLSLINNLNIIGLIATSATIRSNIYTREIYKKNSNIKIYSNSCNLFIPIIEEGILSGQILELVAQKYLSYFYNKNIESLVLGCTHYSIIKNIIAKIINTNLIDPSFQIVNMLYSLLFNNNILNKNNFKSKYRFYVTDVPLNFKLVGEIFLKKNIKYIKIVNLDNY